MVVNVKALLRHPDSEVSGVNLTKPISFPFYIWREIVKVSFLLNL